ncbi:PH domain-containing protein [Saccharomonospora saliphila]|uniref:PH domain-containing protein n=1 Tax=Saccharomonospora saliphila TaxID=369829 RepID=UPI001E572AFF|nr:PH domain-containing protein [Saccharomonospora saliphila]
MSAALAVLLLGVFVTVAVLLRSADTGVIFHLSDQVAMVGIGVLLAGAAMVFALPRVRADADGAEVRNVFVTRRFSWDEVLAVSFPDGASFARLELPDHEYHSLLAVQAVDRDAAVEAVRTLRRLHRAARDTES